MMTLLEETCPSCSGTGLVFESEYILEENCCSNCTDCSGYGVREINIDEK